MLSRPRSIEESVGQSHSFGVRRQRVAMAAAGAARLQSQVTYDPKLLTSWIKAVVFSIDAGMIIPFADHECAPTSMSLFDVYLSVMRQIPAFKAVTVKGFWRCVSTEFNRCLRGKCASKAFYKDGHGDARSPRPPRPPRGGPP